MNEKTVDVDQPIREPRPDIASETKAMQSSRLNRVGMSEIETMIQMEMSAGQVVWIPAKASAYVNLKDPDAKGIHMSRLYLALQDELERDSFSPKVAQRILSRFIETHSELSDQAELRMSFVYACKRRALKSQNDGWRHYPVTIVATRENSKTQYRLETVVTYSSTCPCSAALSRQLMQEKFQGDFDHHRWLSVAQVNDWLRSNGSIATPHSQRSEAKIEVELLHDLEHFPILKLIDQVENSLGTAVQTAVKRADEQEFARANGSNLMFCEDAARQVKSVLEPNSEYADYRVRIDHYESLHPHDATAIVIKGIEGGFTV